MGKTNFSDKCNILGQFWLFYREDAEKNESWGDFFSYNDVALPLAYMLMGDEPLAIVNEKSDGETVIQETWEMLCEFLNVEEDGDYESIGDVFDASPNDVLNPEGADDEESEEESEEKK
jgi:hypothetical protein